MTAGEYILFHCFYWISSIFFMKQPRKERFGLRMVLSLSAGLAAILILGYFYAHAGRNGSFVLLMLNGVLLIPFLKCNWKIFWSAAIYNTVWFRMVWWLMAEVWRMIRQSPIYRLSDIEGYIVVVLFFAFHCLICERTIMRWIPEVGKKHIGPRQLISAMLLGALFEIMAYMPEIYSFSEGITSWLVVFLLQIVCVFILYLQNELFRKSAMRQELAMMELLLRKEKEQYLLARENIAIINQKCHDLKHQIRAIRKSDEADKSRYLKEVEQSIRIYEAIVKTGNEVLDTILTEKSLYCEEREITVSCVTDGQLLEFVNVIDLYSLLGNALDNAIEAVERLKEPEKRQIDVLIYQQQNFVVVNIVNPLEENLVFEEELPITTKEDKNLHGFGMRSMKYILKKYEGFLSVSQEDGYFSLKMLIPMPEGEPDMWEGEPDTSEGASGTSEGASGAH